MDEQRQEKWYFKTWTLVISFLCIGPLMLPLIWANPRFSKKSKLIVSVVIIVFTLILTTLLVRSLRLLGSYYQLILDEKI